MNEEILNLALKEIDRDRIVELASELIRIQSPTGEEKEVAARAAGLFSESHIQTSQVGTDERPIVLADLNRDSKPLIVFNGHVDTVPIADRSAWKTDPFEPVLDAGLLYGRGSSDMKASCAVIIHILEILKHYESSLNGSIQAQLVPDEEKGAQAGTLLLLDLIRSNKLTRPDYVVIGEKSNLKIRIAERGICRINIKFTGKAAHTAYARVEGINAIAMASKAVLALEKPLDKRDPYIGYPVTSVNMIKAGTVINQVPAECAISVDRRPVRDETKESVLEDIQRTLDEAGKSQLGWRYEIELARDARGREAFTPANFTSPDSKLVRAFQAATSHVGLKPEFFVEWAGGTDGRHYREAGIDVVGFGPKGEHAHGPNEFVNVSSLELQAKVYLSTVFRLIG
jgi:acetylornithine deacetylase/succinyl-diaminopimelate desuccinylase family protein